MAEYGVSLHDLDQWNDGLKVQLAESYWRRKHQEARLLVIQFADAWGGDAAQKSRKPTIQQDDIDLEDMTEMSSEEVQEFFLG